MNRAPFDMLEYFDMDNDDGLEVIEVAGDNKEWFPIEPFFPDATLLVLLFKNRGVRHIAVRHESRVAEFDLHQAILRDGSPIGRDRRDLQEPAN